MASIGILGAGTWGAALTKLLAVKGHDTTLWSAVPEEISNLIESRRHPNLPGMIMPESVKYTTDIADVCKDKDIILCVVPSVYVRSTAAKMRDYVPDGQIIVDAAKGIEAETLMTLTEVIADELKKDGKHDNIRLVALSGPTHAEEVAKDMPTAIVSASPDAETARYVRNTFACSLLKVYTNSDIKGVELCGAVKNVIALAVGISTGLGFGDNARAALITRGIAELGALGSAMGCDHRTFAGLTGIGDLIVTATSIHSRNNKCGTLIGRGIPVEDAIKEVGMVVEGLNALPATIKLRDKYGIRMPIITAVNDIVNGNTTPMKAADLLMRDHDTAEY